MPHADPPSALIDALIEPCILEEAVTPASASLLMLIQPELVYFQGHFPDRPVMPGIVLVHWAAKQATRLLGMSLRSGSVRHLKFRRLLFPGTLVTLNLERQATGVQFAFTSIHGEHASGRLDMDAA